MTRSAVPRRIPIALCAMLTSLPAIPVLAQNATAVSDQIEEVLVSARRRGEERVQDVPLAVCVLSEEALRKANIVDLSEVAARTPSFTFGEQIGNQQEAVIRGIGTLRLTGSAAG